MTDDETALKRAEIYFRTYLHTVMPLHDSLVDGMCASPNPPLELAATLEDIGQRYMDMAQTLNSELIRRGRLDDEPEPDDSSDARIETFLGDLVAGAGTIRFHDGTTLDGREALARSAVVRDAIRTALHLARSEAGTGTAGAARPMDYLTRY